MTLKEIEDEMRAELFNEPGTPMWIRGRVRGRVCEWADALAAERERIQERLETARVLIANASDGDWTKQGPQWQAMARKWNAP